MIRETWQRGALSLALLWLLAAGCTPADTDPAMNMESGSEQMDDHEAEQMDHHDAEHMDAASGEGSVPNNGAEIRIMAPEDGASFPAGTDVLVEVETSGFVLGEADNHWHVYVDDASWGMVTGGNHDQVLRGLSPGQHKVSVFMSNSEHQQLADGDSITITVEQ